MNERPMAYQISVQHRVVCPKCGRGMYVVHRMPDRRRGGFKYEQQTLECLKCWSPQTVALMPALSPPSRTSIGTM